MAKIVKPRTGGTLQSEDKWEYTVYSRDASGNVLAVYHLDYKTMSGNNNYRLQYDIKELHLYGGARLGIRYEQQSEVTRDFTLAVSGNGTFDFYNNTNCWVANTLVKPTVSATDFKRELGYKAYELSNHLGNVLSTVSDRRISVGSAGVTTHFIPEVMTYTDYFVYGSSMPGRVFVSGNGAYRYTFNGKEQDAETDLQDYGFRIYNPALGKFLSVDPLAEGYPWNSTYAFAENRIVDGIDFEGLEWAPYDKDGNRLDIKTEGWQNHVAEYRWEGYDITYSVKSGKNAGKTYSSEAELAKAGLKYTDGTNGIIKNYKAKAGTVENGIATSIVSVDPVLTVLAFKSTVYSVNDHQPMETTQYSLDKYLMTAWMYIGTTEGDNPTIQTWIDEMNKDFDRTDETGKPIANDSEEWCGVFVYACLTGSGVSVTHETEGGWQTPAMSSFYVNNWKEGVELQNPDMGAVVRMNYSHVAFVVGWDATYLWILGGNQQPYPAEEDGRGTTVNIRRVKRSQVDAYMSPSGL